MRKFLFSVSRFICIAVCLSTVYASLRLSMPPSISLYRSVCLSVCMCVCMYLSLSLSFSLSIFVNMCVFKYLYNLPSSRSLFLFWRKHLLSHNTMFEKKKTISLLWYEARFFGWQRFDICFVK